MILEQFKRLFNKACGSFAFILIVCGLDIGILPVKKSIASTQSERHREEKQDNMAEENCLPGRVRLALGLMTGLKLQELLIKIPNWDTAVDHAKNSKTMENKQAKLFVTLRHWDIILAFEGI